MTEKTGSARIISLDQFRGYTVAGMFLVNFVGSFAAIKTFLPILSHHHTYCSYADTIMPQFFLAVGFSYRLTFLRRLEQSGPRAAYGASVRRNLGLLLLGLVIHHLDGRFDSWAKLVEVGWNGVLRSALQRNYFQTLTHIAITALWMLPVIAARPWVRAAHAIVSALLFHLLSEWGGYYDWVLKRPGIDGGPLGFLTWTMPMCVGTLAFDVLAGPSKSVTATTPLERRRSVLKIGGAALALMCAGYALSCLKNVTPPNNAAPGHFNLLEPPFFPPAQPVNIWTMSQRAGSVSYVTFGSGFALAVFALFLVACDAGTPIQAGLFRTLGTNALAGYVIHDLVNDAITPFVPKDSPLWYVAIGFAASFGICYLFLRFLEKQRLFFKL